MNTGVGLLLILGTCIALGLPLYVLIGAVSAFLLLNSGFYGGLGELTTIVEMTMSLAEKEVLLAIPFFVIAGAIMSEGDIAKRLIAVARELFSWLPGGLAVSGVFACIFFAAISGSSPVTVIAIGTIIVPALIRERYKERFSHGLITAAGSLGILIPPSIPMIIYEIIDPTRFRDPPAYNLTPDDRPLGLADLFLAGLGPGLLIGLIFSVYAVIHGKRNGATTRAIHWPTLWLRIREGAWALALPLLILGGIYSGVFTPTQAAAVSVVYALVVELLIHRSLDTRQLPRILSECAVLIGSLLVIIALAQGFNKYLELAQVADHAVRVLIEWELSPIAFLLLVNILLLIVGCFMDILSAIIILVPLLSPIAFQLGIHPIHLAVVFIVNLEIGYLTPPLGLNLFVASAIFKKGFGHIVRSILPFLLLMLGALAIVTYIPTVSLGAVSALNGKGVWVPFPEQRLPLRTHRIDEGLRFLAGVARVEEADEEEEEARDPDRPLSIEEMTAMAAQALQEEAMRESLYTSIDALLRDYRLVHRREVSIEGLAIARELEGYMPESEPGDVDAVPALETDPRDGEPEEGGMPSQE